MTFWEIFDQLYAALIFLVVAYFSVMSACMPKPKYIYDEDENDE